MRPHCSGAVWDDGSFYGSKKKTRRAMSPNFRQKNAECKARKEPEHSDENECGFPQSGEALFGNGGD